MKKLTAFTDKTKHIAFSLISTIILFVISFPLMAQTGGGANEKPDSHAEQASAYLQSIEQDPNGVPNSSAWYAQPWIWAIVASILILIIGMLFKSYGKRDMDSEHGL